MILIGDDEAVAWLATQPFVQWDRGNQTKSMSKHAVMTEEVESLLSRPFVFAGRIVEPAHDEPRYLLLGETAEGRWLSLVCTRRENQLRPISCRAMRKKEREIYAANVAN